MVTTPDLLVDGVRFGGAVLGAERLSSSPTLRVGPAAQRMWAIVLVAADTGMLTAPGVVLGESGVVTTMVVGRAAWRIGDLAAAWLSIAAEVRPPEPGLVAAPPVLSEHPPRTAGEAVVIPLGGWNSAAAGTIGIELTSDGRPPLRLSVDFVD